MTTMSCIYFQHLHAVALLSLLHIMLQPVVYRLNKIHSVYLLIKFRSHELVSYIPSFLQALKGIQG